MGCNYGSVKVNAKLKTEAQIRKDFAEQQELDRLQNGHDGYSGGIGSCGMLRFSGRQYELFEDGEREVEESLRKGDALAWQFKVIRETKPLLAAREERKQLVKAMWDNRDPKAMPALKRKVEKLNQKIEKIERTQAAKSNKWAWAISTACPE